jgi:hypothetical protein
MSPNHPVSAALREAVQSDLAKLARQRRRRLLLLSIVGLVASVGLALKMGVRSPTAGTWLHWATLVAFGTGGLTLYAYAFGVRFMSRSLFTPVIGAGILGTLGLIGMSIGGVTPPPPFLAGAMCMGHGMAASAAIIVLALLVGRKVMRRHAPTGLLIGVGAGMLGVIPLHLACVHDSAAHLMVWHALVPVIAGLVGGVIWLLMEPPPEEEV